jgi:hypothetical protein
LIAIKAICLALADMIEADEDTEAAARLVPMLGQVIQAVN